MSQAVKYKSLPIFRRMAVPLFVPLYSSRKVKPRKTLDKLSDFEIRQQCGVPSYALRDIIDLYKPLEESFCRNIPLETKVLTFLNYLRSGSSQWLVGSAGGISQPSASRIINACCQHTLSFAHLIINFPETVDKQNHVKQKFHQIAGLESVLGAVDGTHVPILSPKENEYTYVNRKLFHSINCQVVADPHYRLFDIVAKWPGSTHDSYMWKNSSVRRRLNSGELGNSVFIGKWPNLLFHSNDSPTMSNKFIQLHISFF